MRHTFYLFALLTTCTFAFNAQGDDKLQVIELLKAKSNYFDVEVLQGEKKEQLVRTVISGPPQPPGGYRLDHQAVDLPDVHRQKGINILSNVPAFSWSFGCSATSAAMIAGYYDRVGYANMYTGPTNGGVMVLNNSIWPSWYDSTGARRDQCPLSATHSGLDGRTTRGHVDDYWIGYNRTGPDPYQTKGLTQHTKGECTADYMNTNMWVNSSDGWNVDGSTIFYTYYSSSRLDCSTYTTYPYNTRGDVGLKKFYESRGYEVSECYTQRTDNSVAGGFSFYDFKREIDAGRPVMFHVTGHTMVGVGYNDSTQSIYIHDTWDHSTHTMSWGGAYYDMVMYSVTIVKLKPAPAPVPVKTTNPISHILSYLMSIDK